MPSVSHLLFADDSFIFCRATSEECSVLKGILVQFVVAFGLVVNFHKSGIMFSANVDPGLKKSLCNILGGFMNRLILAGTWVRRL